MSLPDPLLERVARLAPTPGLHPTAHPRLTAIRVDAPQAKQPVVYEPGLVVVLQGAKEAQLGDAHYVYDRLHHLVLSAPLPLECRVTRASAEEPYLALMLTFDPVTVGELLTDAADGLAAEPEPDADRRAIHVSRTGPELVDVLRRWLTALEDPAAAAVLAPMAERELLFHLARGPQAAHLRAAASLDRPARRIGAVLRHLQQHLADDHGIPDLARRAAMSPSTFHEHFRAVTSESPLRYLKRLRLASARGLMQHGGLGAAEAAARVGYRSPSQFSREFRREYGLAPTEDARRSRGA